ncbi:MAG TPA: GNAT family N-acetyltransferase [Acidimicrobiales bacterium]|nr:GNAT family N-acetyltransferase [Acidimicrobiales bacterium]
MDAPGTWEADVLLADGGTMHLRPIGPGDAGLLEAFHARQSPESIYYRYFSPRPSLSKADLERLTRVDYVDRMAFIGLIGAELVGVARYDRYPTTEVAEVAFFTDEEHRGRGVATILLEYLAAAARVTGLSGFVAQVLPENRRMLSVFARAGFDVRSNFADGVIEVTLGIEPTDEARRLVSERAQAAFSKSVHRLLAPRSVAVIGASRRPEKIGNLVFRSILEGGFTGTVVPVNSAADQVAGVRAWPSIAAVPDDIDVAVVCVPRDAVAGVVTDCARRHVHALVIISAGFSDLDEEGAELERTVVARARRWGMRVLGPNSMGVINTADGVELKATFVDVHPRPGTIGVSSQSGTLGAAIIEHAARRGLGISTFVSLGNQSDVSNSDLLSYWEDDDDTDLVLLYLESFGDPSTFARTTRHLARAKPVVAVKSGGALPLDSGGTGLPLTGNIDALLTQTGMIRVDTLSELLDVALVLTHQPIARGRRLAILSNARSPAVLALDAASGVDLVPAEVSYAGRANPVDLGFDVDPATFADALGVLCHDPGVDAVLVLCTPSTPGAIDAFEPLIIEAAAGSPVPVVATYLGLKPRANPPRPSAVPVFAFPESAVRAVGRIARYGEWLERDPGRLPETDLVFIDELHAVVDEARLTGSGWLDHDIAARVVAAAGASLVDRIVVHSAIEAIAAAETIGWPVALKAAGLARPAKTEAGGVAVDVHDADELVRAYARMQSLLGEAMDTCVVQQMAGSGVDVRIGLVRNDLVGAVLTLELDRAFVPDATPPAVQVVPCSDTDAHSMVERAGLIGAFADPQVGSAHLVGVDANAAVESVVQLLQQLSVTAESFPEIAAIVLDPVIVSAGRASVTDVRVRLDLVAPEERLPVRRLADR